MKHTLWIASLLTILTCLAIQPAAADEVFFQDHFEAADLQSGWSWLREDPQGWGLSSGQLKIRTNGGYLWEARNDQKNILLLDLPSEAEAEGFVAEITVDGRLLLDQAYEHGGLIWYLDDDHWVTLTQLNHVEHKTQKIMLVHEVAGRGLARQSKAVPYTSQRVNLRFAVAGRQFTGFYREPGQTSWEKLGTLEFPEFEGTPRLGLVAGQGVAEKEHWVYFDDFRVRLGTP